MARALLPSQGHSGFNIHPALRLFLHFSHLRAGFGHAVLLFGMQQPCLGHMGAAQREPSSGGQALSSLYAVS